MQDDYDPIGEPPTTQDFGLGDVVPLPTGQTLFESVRHEDEDGEHWFARELQTTYGYSKWQKFEEIIRRAIKAIDGIGGIGAGQTNITHVGKNVKVGFGDREIDDYRLSRYGAYMLAMECDGTKPEIGAAKTYFAVQTHYAEQEQAKQERMPAIPQTYAETLRALADAVEAEERERTARIAAEQQTALMAPKVDAYEKLVESKQTFPMRRAAYILNNDRMINTGEQRLFRIIRAWRMVDVNDVPYIKYAKYLTLVPRTYTHPVTGKVREARPQLRLTVEGLVFVHRRLGGVEPINFDLAPED